MKRIINLVFDRIERLLWFRHLLWTLRRGDNSVREFEYDTKTMSSRTVDIISEDAIRWLQLHRNDYLDSTNSGKATGTENSTEVTEEES